MGVGVQRQVAHAQRGHPARRPAPQQRAHAGEQLLALERLDQVVVGADVEALHARLQRVARGQHEDRRVVAVVAQALGDLDAVQPRQAEVEHDDVGQERVRLVERRDAVARELDLVALQAQRALEDLGDLLVVLDDEHADGAAEASIATDGTGRRSGKARTFQPRFSEAGRRAHGVEGGPAGRRRTTAAVRSRKPRRPQDAPSRARAAPRRRLAEPARARAAPLDLIGLGLVAAALFFAFVVYFGWDGGQAGDAGRRGPALAARRACTTSCPSR